MYETLKRYLWPHTLVPLAAVVIIDYVKFLGVFVQLALTVYLVAQGLALVAGFVVAALASLTPASPWAKVFDLNVARALPLVLAGRATFHYLMTETSPRGSPESCPAKTPPLAGPAVEREHDLEPEASL